jgi:RNA recognition motif-containing protein
MEGESHPTLYINNINEKIKKEPLKKLLYMLFSQYGKVRQIVACKGIKMRGQAWIVFDNDSSAANALKGKQGFKLYGKELRIQFAKAKSHEVARKEGLTVVKSAPTVGIAKSSNKRARNADDDDDEADVPPAKEAKLISNSTPNKILLVQNLPNSVTKEQLQQSFTGAAGLIDIRVVAGRGLAFVEFDNEGSAGIALQQLNGKPLAGSSSSLQLTFSS